VIQSPNSYYLNPKSLNKNLDPNKENYSAQELDIERALRPLSFDDFAGQEAVLENFLISILNDNISTTQEQDLLEKEKILIIDFMFFMLIEAILMSLSGILKI